jgi:hypothetical protein
LPPFRGGVRIPRRLLRDSVGHTLFCLLAHAVPPACAPMNWRKIVPPSPWHAQPTRVYPGTRPSILMEIVQADPRDRMRQARPGGDAEGEALPLLGSMKVAKPTGRFNETRPL